MSVFKNIKAAVLMAAIALGLLFSSTERSQATYYENYYTYYQDYYSYYEQGYGTAYLYYAYAYYYYYIAGYYSDYYDYYYDSFGSKSPTYRGSQPYWDSIWNAYSVYGDEYARSA